MPKLTNTHKINKKPARNEPRNNARNVAIVLSGGGAKGDFEVGAVRFLYEQGIRPNVLCGTSVGAINAIKLAEGDGALEGLINIWERLMHNHDMYQPEAWLADPDFPQEMRKMLMGESGGIALDDPEEYFIGDNSFLGGVVNGVGGLLYLVKSGVGDLLTALGKVIQARAILNLNPIEKRLRSPSFLNLDKVKQSGIKLRLAVVGLESGRLRYVTETGQLLERSLGKDGSPQPVARKRLAPACQALADIISTLTDEKRRLQQDLLDSSSKTAGAEIAAQIREITQQATEHKRLLDQCRHERDKNGHLVNPDVWEPVPNVGLIEGVMASASIPGAFPPVVMAGESYIDGGAREVMPLKAAVDLKATEIYAIGAAPPEPAVASSFKGKKLPDILFRSVNDIIMNEITHGDLNPHGGWGAAKVFTILPSFEVHGTLVIDPGLISINMAYGYMRAADVVKGVDPEGRVYAIADEITRLRADVWRQECIVHGMPIPTQPGSAGGVSDPSLQTQVNRKKQQIQALVDERRRSGGLLPPDADLWSRVPERHPWLLQKLSVTVDPLVLDVPAQVIIRAVDANNQLVQGQVVINGKPVANTNTPFSYTFSRHPKKVFDPMTRSWRIEEVDPFGKVVAPTYADTGIPFKFIEAAPLISDAVFVSQTAPPSAMTAGQEFDVRVTMRNTGGTTWTAADGFYLGSKSPQDNIHWGSGRIALPHSVPPATEVTFAFRIKAPSTPSTYGFQWQMVHETKEWFGAATPIVNVQVAAPAPAQRPLNIKAGFTQRPFGRGQVLFTINVSVMFADGAREKVPNATVLLNDGSSHPANQPFSIRGEVGGELPSGVVRIPGYPDKPFNYGGPTGAATFDLISDFSATPNNPGGTGVLRFGYMASLGSPLIPYTASLRQVLPGLDKFNDGINDNPAVHFNTTKEPLTYLSIAQPGDMLNLHPGPAGQYSVVRFIAPADGTYSVTGSYQGLDFVNLQTSTDVGVLLNSDASKPLFSGYVKGFGNKQPFTFATRLTAGDTLDFFVGYGGNHYYHDSTGLKATIIGGA